MTFDESSITDSGREALSEALRISFRLLRFVMILLALAYLASGIYLVRQHEKALVLIFGKIAGQGEERLKEPGLHWTWPRPISEIVRIPAERVLSLTSRAHWYQQEADFQDNAHPRDTLNPAADGYNLSGDANILHSQWAVRYTVNQPERHLFAWRDAEAVMLRELDRAVVAATAHHSIDRALRTDIEAWRDAVAAELRQRCLEMNLGVQIHGVDLLAVAPPRQIAEAFADVVRAEQHRARQISDARAYAVRTVNEAQGEAARRVAAGEADQRRLVAAVRARAEYFERIHDDYARNPDLIARTLLQDGVTRALAGVNEKYVVHRSSTGEQELRLMLGPDRKPLPDLE